MIKTYNIGKWMFIKNDSAIKNKKLIEEDLKKEKNGKIGKYMFFSDDKESLIEISKKILEEYNLYNAKVNIEKNNKNKGFGFVLCIYDVANDFNSGGKLKKELTKYADFENILYRYWKYDKDTLEGKYSDQFKKDEINN